jgi:murein DD-endopeptidase MepM/ murein hydrolase activator NlpD
MERFKRISNRSSKTKIRGVDAMINLDSKLMGISDVLAGPKYREIFATRTAVIVTIVLLLGLPGARGMAGASQPDVHLSSDTIPQGAVSLISVKAQEGKTPRVTWMKKTVYLAPNRKKTDWYGVIASDLRAKPGDYTIRVAFSPSGRIKKIPVKITKKDYGARRLTLPKKMVDLDAATLKRARKESKKMKALWEAAPSEPLWRGPFLRPVPGDVVGPFGRRSFINDQLRAPHSGVDLRGARGTPIKAMNHGKVVLTGDHFFTGLTVVIDHGGGIQSMFFHLDKIMVKKGQTVSKGQVIGLVGSTGRATGPHLHLGLRVNGARVDPLMLTAISRELEE